VGKQQKRPYGRLRCRWDDKIKIYIKEIECDGGHCIFI
jgi:hypothetical protein